MDEPYLSAFFLKTSRYLILFRVETAVSMNLATFSMRLAGSDQMNQKRSHHPCRSSLA